MLTTRFEDKEFNRMIDELADTSRRTDIEVLTGQAIHILRAIVGFTRVAWGRFREQGKAVAGWWPSWIGLGVFSTPKGTSSRVLSTAEGSFTDGRQRFNQPFVAMTNSVGYIGKLEDEDQTLHKAYAGRASDMESELERRYGRFLKRASGK